MDQKIKEMLPYFRTLGFDLEALPYIILLFPKHWNYINLQSNEELNIKDVQVFDKGYEIMVMGKSIDYSLDLLQKFCHTEIMLNLDIDKKQELQDRLMKELQEKFNNADLKDLESLNVSDLFKK